MTVSRISGRAAALALIVVGAGLAPMTPARATAPGPDGDLVVSAAGSGPIRGIYTLNPSDPAPAISTVEEGNASLSAGAVFSPGGLLAMSLPDPANGGRPTIFTGTRTYKTDLTQLTRVTTTHDVDVEPAWSPDGSKLAFTGTETVLGPSRIVYQHGGDLWSMISDGSDQKKIADAASSPSWNAEGTAIVFTRSSGGVVQLAAMNPDGTDNHLLKAGQQANDPAWSPDGSKVVFDSTGLAGDTTGHSQVAVLDVVAGTVTQLTSDPTRDLYFPSWSPDGGSIAFEAFDPATQAAMIQQVPAAGGTPADVVAGHHPVYSPDGQKLAFNAVSGNGSFDVFTVSVAGGPTTQVTNSPNDEWAPTWSRDGLKLAYISDENGNGEVWTRSANGSGVAKNLTTTTSGSDDTPTWGPRLNQTSSRIYVANADGNGVAAVTLPITGGQPTWSPDGTRLAFSDGGHLWTIGPDGLGLTAVTTSFTGTTDADPSWSPDGSRLAFSGADGSGNQAVYTINPANGTGLTKLAGGAGDHDLSPAWSPSGQQIAFVNGGDVYAVDADGSNLHLVKGMAPTLVADNVDWGATGPPDTAIDTGPSGTFGGHDATFTFSSTRTPATFECMLEAAYNDPAFAWSSCGSGSTGTKTYAGLPAGTFTFRVRASTSAGSDATPASSQFTVAPPAVVVTLDGAGSGTVTSSPTGIHCSPTTTDCIKVFSGSVTLTAKPDGLSTFTGWSGDCTGIGPCSVQAVNSTKHVTATFAVSGNGPPPCTGTATTKTVANWSVKGCFVAAGATFTTDQLVEVNGLKVSPTDTTLTLDPTAGTLTAPSGGRVTVLAGPTTVGGKQVGPVPLSVGALSLNLKAASITLAAPPSGALLGMPLTGTVTLSTPVAGTVKVDVAVQLPAVLGKGAATAHLLSTAASGLQVTSLAIGPVDATLAALFRVKGASFSYDAATGWSAHGTVQVPGGSGTFAATFGYAAGVLQKADVSLTHVSVAGFLSASSFQLHYLAGSWSASAVVNKTTSMSGSLTFADGVLTTLHLHASHLSAFGLVSVDNLDLAYDSSTGWSVSGTLPGAAAFDGSMTYSGGVLTGAVLHIASLSVGGAFGLTGLDLTYDSDGTRDHWHGTASLAGGETVTADLALVGGALSSASFDASHLAIFGVLDVTAFHLGLNAAGATTCAASATRWGVSGSVTVPGAASFAVDAGVGFAESGALDCGLLHVSKARLNGVVDVNELLISVVSGGTWSGKADVQFPGGLAFTANVAFANGALTSLGGSITVPGAGIPVGTSGVFLKGGSFQLETSPSWRITGSLNLTGGPTVPVINTAAIGLNGSLQLRFPNGVQPAGFRVDGALTLANLPLSEAYVDYSYPFDVDLAGCLGTCASGLQLAGGLATIQASITGKVRGTSAFEVTGDAGVSLHFKGCVVWCIDKTVGIQGSVIASNIGLAACGHIEGMSDDWAAGIGYTWGSTPTAFTGCSLAAYQSISGSALRRAAAGAGTAFAVPSGLPVQAFRFTGTTAPPFVTLTGPNGESISARNDTAGVADGHVVMLDPASKQTLVLVDHPSAGTWTATLQDDSAPLASAQGAKGLPAPDVTGTVSGSGLSRSLAWTLAPRAGQVVTFVETAGDVSHELGRTSLASGTLAFTPAAGAAGTRKVVAEVVQDGVPRASIDLGTFEAPARDVLTVSKTGSGTVTSTPAGISCGATCSADVIAGSPVTLKAVPASGWRFASWRGLCAGTAPTCTSSPSGSAAVAATFVKLPPPTLTKVSPAAAKPGAKVTLTGTQFLGATRVGLAAVPSRFTVVSATTITFVVPTNALTNKVTVTAPSGAVTSAAVLKVIPVVSTLTPTAGRVGGRLTIKGAALTNATRVTVGGVLAKVVGRSWSSLVVVVPSTARTGRVVVTTAGGTATSSQTFTVRR